MENSESQFALISQFLKLLSSSKKKRLFETLKKEENITLNPKQIHLPVSELLDKENFTISYLFSLRPSLFAIGKKFFLRVKLVISSVSSYYLL